MARGSGEERCGLKAGSFQIRFVFFIPKKQNTMKQSLDIQNPPIAWWGGVQTPPKNRTSGGGPGCLGNDKMELPPPTCDAIASSPPG